MSGHTPGPWLYDRDTQDINDAPADDWRKRRICQVMGWDDETRANARLIAAAPELLHVVRGFVEWCEHASGDPDSTVLYEAGVAAIAKATGGEV